MKYLFVALFLFGCYDKDLALLFAYTGEFPPLEINIRPQLADKVFLVGDPTGLRVVEFGRIIRLDEKLVSVSILDGHGASGGGLYDSYGRLAGIQELVRLDGQSFIFAGAIHGRVIREFLQK